MSATSTEAPWGRAPDGAFAVGKDGAVDLPYWCDRAIGQGWVALGHGAGAGPLHPVLEAFTQALNALGWNVLRYAFPFRAARPEARIGRDAPALGQAAVAAAFAAARASTFTGRSIVNVEPSPGRLVAVMSPPGKSPCCTARAHTSPWCRPI